MIPRGGGLALSLHVQNGVKTIHRWRVIIVDDHEPSRSALRAAVLAARGTVAGETTSSAEGVSLVRRVGPDVAVFAAGLPDGDGVAAAAEVSAASLCPVVLFTSHTDEALVERAREGGVMAYLLKPLRPAEVIPTLDLAVARFDEAQTLRRRLEERKVIERAKGALMSRLGLSEDDAFRRLRRAAMDSRRPMAEVARALLLSESVVQTSPPSTLSAGARR
jgi:response regulator NasT